MATKKKGPNKAKQPTDPILPALAVGEKLLAGFREELTNIKNPGNPKQNIWGILSEVQQDEILDRTSRRISHHFRLAFEAILAADVPAVHATLAAVTFGAKGIRGSLEIPAGSAHRHALADFSGKQVLVILTDELDEYLESMSSVKPDKDQAELALAEQAEEDPRTVENLLEDAKTFAEELGETDIDWSEKGRDGLLDYVKWAEGEIEKRLSS